MRQKPPRPNNAPKWRSKSLRFTHQFPQAALESRPTTAATIAFAAEAKQKSPSISQEIEGQRE
jgi:hypothetical protein